MTTFDDILPLVKEALTEEANLVEKSLNGKRLIINRDLMGRVRLILPSKLNKAGTEAIKRIAENLAERLGPHGYPQGQTFLQEDDLPVLSDVPKFRLEGFENIWVVDRQVQGLGWAQVEKPAPTKVPRLAFFSIKGGVGRSTALAVYAWHLARQGKRVLVLDLDLESPGVSSNLLLDDRQPAYGITDWLVEELVGNGKSVFGELVSRSNLSQNLDGDILVVPAHGARPGEYIAKLGRVFLPLPQKRTQHKTALETWSQRLLNLIKALEQQHHVDVVLLDSRAGIDDTASSIVTDLGAQVLLFAIDSKQTWTGYRILFDHWRRTGAAPNIRERLQIVAALVPEMNRLDYLELFRERSWNLFLECLYDEVPSSNAAGDSWSFELSAESAPHYPIPIEWHRGFAALQDFASFDPYLVQGVFGRFIDNVDELLF